MFDKLIELLHKIRISMKCCISSNCSLNENNLDNNSIDEEITKNYEEFKPK